MVTADGLDEVMDFDVVVRVDGDGNVAKTGEYGPELHDGVVSAGWSLLDGYSGQYGYSGPVMHSSEYIGGSMAEHIVSTPGVYVALVDYSSDDSGPDGWAVAVKDDSGE